MAGQSGNWKFRPGRVPSVAVLVLLPVLVSLGIWQLQRAEHKRDMFQDFETGAQTISVAGSSLLATLARLPRYQRIELAGRYESGRQFLLDNMTSDGVAGYHVLTPFAVDDAGARVLVNRGWIPRDFGTAILPNVAVGESERRVAGRIKRLPRPGLELSAADGALPEWPRVVQFPTMGELVDGLGVELAPRMVLLDPAAADGFIRDWQPTEFGPERHVGYAVQWFALAATLLIIYLALNLKRNGNDGR